MAHVSLVVVSHSRSLGEGLVELLRQLAQGVHIVSASGVEHGLGTDATKVMDAIASCPENQDIVILFDLGSALMSCEMALDLLPENQRERAVIADAPLVEGAVAAAVEASLGSPVEAVLARAQEAKTMAKL